MSRGIEPGLILSAAAHLGLIALALSFAPQPRPVPEAGEVAVTLISVAEFEAMGAAAPEAPMGAVAPLTLPEQPPDLPPIAPAPEPEPPRRSPPELAEVEAEAPPAVTESTASLLTSKPPSPRPDRSPSRTETPRKAQPAKRTATTPQRGGSGGAGTQAAGARGTGVQGTDDWAAAIRRKVDANKHYPEVARRMRLTGQVELQLKVQADGRLALVRVLRSSGQAILDRAALDAVRRAGRFPAAPQGRRAAGDFSVVLSFRP